MEFLVVISELWRQVTVDYSQINFCFFLPQQTLSLCYVRRVDTHYMLTSIIKIYYGLKRGLV